MTTSSPWTPEHQFVANLISEVHEVDSSKCGLDERLRGDVIRLSGREFIEIETLIVKGLEIEFDDDPIFYPFVSIEYEQTDIRDGGIRQLMKVLGIEFELESLRGRDPHDPITLTESVLSLITVRALVNFVNANKA